MNYEHTKFILGKQFLPWDYMDILRSAMENERDITFLACSCFNFGFIEGKRVERAKKRKFKVVNISKANNTTYKGGDAA